MWGHKLLLIGKGTCGLLRNSSILRQIVLLPELMCIHNLWGKDFAKAKSNFILNSAALESQKVGKLV